MAAYGPTRTSGDVRVRAAFRGIADIAGGKEIGTITLQHRRAPSAPRVVRGIEPGGNTPRERKRAWVLRKRASQPRRGLAVSRRVACLFA